MNEPRRGSDYTDLVNYDPLSNFLPIVIVERMVSMRRTSIYKGVSDGTFPAPVQLGEMRASGRAARVAWVRSEIEAWIAAKIAAPRAGHVQVPEKNPALAAMR